MLERDVADAGSRAAETISELADHAMSIAREVGQAARPTVQHGAESLSHVLERAAGVIGETAENLAGDGRVSEASQTARTRLADASERFAKSIRPQRKTHRIRRIFVAAAIVGGIVVLVQSPLRAKVQERIFGASPADDELPPITLPDEPRSTGPDFYHEPAETDIRGTAANAESHPAPPEIPAADTARN